jgi:hypothetical protein
LLSKAVSPSGAKATTVLIPKREIEAWLLYDPQAIAKAFGEAKFLTLPGNPESIHDPKKKMWELVYNKYHKNYVNTIHNEKIAKHLNVELLNRSKSFAPHPLFVAKVRKLLR